MNVHLSRLDPESCDYLWNVWEKQNSNGVGVFISRGKTVPALGIGRTIVAIIACAIIVALSLPRKPQTAILVWQCALTAFAVLLLVSGHVSRRRRRAFNRTPQMGNFTFMDPRFLWEVERNRVSITNLSDLETVEGTHRYVNGSYIETNLVLRRASGRKKLSVPGKDKAEQIVRYHSAIKAFDGMAREGKLGELGKNPLAIGAMAVQFGVQGAKQIDLSGVDCSRPFPSPQEVDPAVTLSTGNSPRAMNYSRLAGVPWLMAAGTLAVALLGYPRLNQILYDNDCYAKADEMSAKNHSPTALREYLADPSNVRHRDEAQRQINGYYDVAIARLKKRAEHNPKVDQKLFGALLALVEGLKTADSPVVTVGFRSRQEVEPVTDAEKRAEKEAYDYRLKDNSELREIARSSGTSSAILPTGRCFSAAETVQREGVIIRSLQEAMKSVLDADILSLVPAKEGQKPLIEVSYYTAPSGGFFLYHTTVHNSYGSTTDRVNGLLRSYSTDWMITLRPPGGAKEYACRLASAPKSKLVYKDNPNDPVWAPYSVILYSGFWSMSAELVSEFAMNPGPDRVEFSYAEVASSK